VKKASERRVRDLTQSRDIRGLVNALVDKEWDTQALASNALYDLKDTRANPLILPLLSHPDKSIRKCALRAIGFSGNKSVVENLIKYLEKGNAEDTLYYSLCDIGDSIALDPLFRDVQAHPDQTNILWLVTGLMYGNINDVRVSAFLASFVNESVNKSPDLSWIFPEVYPRNFFQIFGKLRQLNWQPDSTFCGILYCLFISPEKLKQLNPACFTRFIEMQLSFIPTRLYHKGFIGETIEREASVQCAELLGKLYRSAALLPEQRSSILKSSDQIVIERDNRVTESDSDGTYNHNITVQYPLSYFLKEPSLRVRSDVLIHER
jgi:hypothetical protein